MQNESNIVDGADLLYKGSHKMHWSLCKLCKVGRWTRVSDTREYCRQCASKLLTVKRSPGDCVTKRASELGHIAKRDYLMYQSVCPKCGAQCWKSHRNLIGKLCPECARLYSSQRASSLIAENHPRWVNKLSYLDKNIGYVFVYVPVSSPFRVMVSKGNYALEHRIVLAQHLGRPLSKWEVVHHINGIKTDNRIENLQLLEHQGIHNTQIQRHIKSLEDRIADLESMSLLLLWHIKDIRKDNAVLNSGNEPDKCVETIHPASKMDDDIVRTSQKCETNVGHHQPAPDYARRRRGCHRHHRSLQRSLVL